ncbi:hypothetical protein [Okeania sp. SIO1I7]|uniref:hypothetical protein n=1 Tax=Okeania sp. SIO1I7 TaxID=2607772 RepID=UPI0013FC684B|nr:hypothetical protein [Okeania sp. SIO1I7]NET24999.1 hypothetical protein [Okeania sp. SIO1I7]
MSGFRRVGNILVDRGTEETAIPSSKVEPDQPLQVTVFSIEIGGRYINHRVGLRLEGNAANLPLPSKSAASRRVGWRGPLAVRPSTKRKSSSIFQSRYFPAECCANR